MFGRIPRPKHDARESDLETAYCAEIVATTYQAMGLLAPRRAGWYDPGRFWGGDAAALPRGIASAGRSSWRSPRVLRQAEGVGDRAASGDVSRW